MRVAILAIALLCSSIARAHADVGTALATDDPVVLAAAVHDLETAPDAPGDALLAAARACEDRLHAPARALALYERIERDHGSERAAVIAGRRATTLRAELGTGDTHDAQAADLAALIAGADALPTAEVMRRGDALAAASWPGAAGAALWLAEWARRSGRFADAQARYAAVAARWPGTPIGIAAIRGGAACAIEAHAWTIAAGLVDQLPAIDPADRAVRDELRAQLAGNRARLRLYAAAWVIAIAALLALVGSLAAAMRATGRRPALRPPFEILLFAPVAIVLVAVALTASSAIAPAVATIGGGGIVLGWLSGATLDLLRATGRSVRSRALAQIAVCIAGVLALAYIAVMRDGLLDALLETIKYGPEM